MIPSFGRSDLLYGKSYSARRAEDYLQAIESEILESFDAKQLNAITQILNTAIPKPSPKIVDLRFGINLILFRFYIVLFVGKEQRRYQRRYVPEKVSRVGNVIASIILLVGLNLLISLFIFLSLYFVKSALGFDIFPHRHLGDVLRQL